MPFHKLEVYRKAYDLSLQVHKLTLAFPDFEKYEIGQQLRKCTKSICANFGEGMGKQGSSKEVVRFLRNALGSCDETRIWLEYARDLGYMSPDRYGNFYQRYEEVGRMLNGLVKKWMLR